jgi:leader peptidase (prepilin peptidase) / N-methyltransferase
MIARSLDKIGLRPSRDASLGAARIGVLALACIAASFYGSSGLPALLGACLALLMLTIAAVDARLFIIPNELTAAALVLAAANAVVADPQFPVQSVATAALRGAILALLFFVLRELYLRLRGRDGLGLGDVKLAAVAGAWLDWSMMPIAVQIAALAALGYYAWRHFVAGRPVRATSRIPFGLFLAPSIWIGWLLQALLGGQ